MRAEALYILPRCCAKKGSSVRVELNIVPGEGVFLLSLQGLFPGISRCQGEDQGFKRIAFHIRLEHGYFYIVPYNACIVRMCYFYYHFTIPLRRQPG